MQVDKPAYIFICLQVMFVSESASWCSRACVSALLLCVGLVAVHRKITPVPYQRLFYYPHEKDRFSCKL